MTSEAQAPTAAPTLLVLAGGLGSRYGGLKQLEAVGPSGETLMDYAVYDALRAGFRRIVFLIRREIDEAFRSQIGSRYSGNLEVDYAHQSLDDLPVNFTTPPERIRPWGTGHATWAARDVVGTDSFAVINADDFYGLETFQRLAESFSSAQSYASADFLTCFMAGFRLDETLSENGSVARGICQTEDGCLRSVEEWTGIATDSSGSITGTNTRGEPGSLTGLETASMNVWGFPPGIFPLLEKSFAAFLARSDDLSAAEFYLPAAVDEWIHEGLATVRVRPTPCRWLGVTYKEDKPKVIEVLAEMTREGAYPKNLWA